MRLSQAQRLLLIVGLFWYAQYVYMPNTAPYLLAQKVSADFVGIVVGAYGFTQMVARFGIGLISDILGRYKIIIVAGCIFAAVSSVVRIVVPTGPGFLTANLMSGLASSTWLCFMLLYTSSVAKANLLQALGYVFAANNLGIMLSFISSAVLYQYFGMTLLCALSVVAGTLASILAVGLSDIKREPSPEQPDEPAKPGLTSLLSVIFSGRLWFFAFLATIQQGITMGTVMSFSQEVARQMGGSAVQMGLMTIVFIAFCVISSYLVAKPLIARINPGVLMGVTLILLAFYCWASPHVTSVYELIALQALMGSSLGFVLTVSNSEALKGVDPKKKSTALGLYQAIFAAGMTFVPMIAGFIIEHSDGQFDGAFNFQAGLCLLGALLVAIYYLRARTKAYGAHHD